MKQILKFLVLMVTVFWMFTACEESGAGSNGGGSNVDTSLVAAWNFDSDTTASGSGSDGIAITETGDVSISTSDIKVGSGSAYFDGSSYLKTDSKVDFNCSEGFTVSFWAKISTYSTDAYYLKWGDNNYIKCGTDPSIYTLYIYIGDCSTTLGASRFSLDTDTWVHITAVAEYDADNGKKIYTYYRNGNQVYSATFSTTSASFLEKLDGGNVVIGQGYTGYIDNLLFYNRALSVDEINTLYNYGS